MIQLNNSNTQTFKYGNKRIRTIDFNNQTLVIGNDVLHALDLNTHLIINSLMNDERYPMESGLKLVDMDDSKYKLILLNAKGLFKIINLVNTPKFRLFEKWVDEYLFPMLEEKVAC
jgi:prophage antirepressor-like protein